MDSYRKLKFEELKNKYYKTLKEKWASIEHSYNYSGNYGSSSHITQFLKSGFEYIDKITEDLFKSERTVLSSKKSISDNYFADLRSDIEGLILNEIEMIRSEAEKISPYLIGHSNNSSFVNPIVQEEKQSIIESIKRKTDLLENEFKQGILQQPHSVSQISVTGNVGMINTGQMQISGLLEIKLEEFKKGGQNELFDAFSILVKTIKESDIKEDDKDEQIGNVDFLVEQCKTPKEERKNGVIKTIERILSNAANLSTIWGQVGQMIMSALSK